MLKIKNFAESVVWRYSVKKVFLEISQNSQESNCARVSFFNKVAGPRPATLLKKETLAQVFSCKFCETVKNTFFHRTPLVAASNYISVCRRIKPTFISN